MNSSCAPVPAAAADLNEDHLRLLLATEAADLGIFEWDLQSDQGFWQNARMYEIFGVAPDSDVDLLQSFLLALHLDDAPVAQQALNRALENGDYRMQCRIHRHHDRALRWVEARGRIRFDAQRRPLRLIGVLADITEQKEVQSALHEADRMKDEFLAMLAHELRNPLAPLATALAIVERGDAGCRSEACDVMHRQLHQLTRLVDDLLEVARITQGRIELRRTLIPIVEPLEAAIESVRAQLDDRRQQLAVTLDPGVGCVDGDPVRLSQVFVNLLHNASKYTQDGGSIRVDARAADDMLRIEVADDGVGISPDLLPHVFELFTQAQRTLARSQGGLGIGLALVRRIVDLHGGRVHARSDGVGAGASFVVELPRAAAALSATAAPPRAADRRSDERGTAVAPQPAAGARVLVVDDNADAADSLATLLTLHGYEVRKAYEGVAALAAGDDFDADAVILDIGLPGMNGYQVAARLRERGTGALLIAVTGYGQASDVERAYASGFHHHLVKPVDVDELLALLARAPRRSA